MASCLFHDFDSGEGKTVGKQQQKMSKSLLTWLLLYFGLVIAISNFEVDFLIRLENFSINTLVLHRTTLKSLA